MYIFYELIKSKKKDFVYVLGYYIIEVKLFVSFERCLFCFVLVGFDKVESFLGKF